MPKLSPPGWLRPSRGGDDAALCPGARPTRVLIAGLVLVVWACYWASSLRRGRMLAAEKTLIPAHEFLSVDFQSNWFAVRCWLGMATTTLRRSTIRSVGRSSIRRSSCRCSRGRVSSGPSRDDGLVRRAHGTGRPGGVVSRRRAYINSVSRRFRCRAVAAFLSTMPVMFAAPSGQLGPAARAAASGTHVGTQRTVAAAGCGRRALSDADGVDQDLSRAAAPRAARASALASSWRLRGRQPRGAAAGWWPQLHGDRRHDPDGGRKCTYGLLPRLPQLEPGVATVLAGDAAGVSDGRPRSARSGRRDAADRGGRHVAAHSDKNAAG